MARSTIIEPPDRDLFEDPRRAKAYLASPNGAVYINNKLRNCNGALKGTPQAIMKITSYAGGATASRKHINYIERKSEFGLEDEQGYRFRGEREIEDLLDEWSVDFSRKQGDKTDKIKLVFDATKVDKKLLYRDIKSYSEKHFPENSIRVDVGRSKNKTNQITLTINNDAAVKLDIDSLGVQFKAEYKRTFKTIETVKNRKTRDVLNVVFSSQEGTDPDKLVKAVRGFAKEQFGKSDHRYVFALHLDTGKPHVHVAVKMVNDNGKKLDPKKWDLNQWRELYADYCRAHGIEVIASRQYERGIVQKGESREFRQMQKRNIIPENKRKAWRRIKQLYLSNEPKHAWEVAIQNRSNMQRNELKIISVFLRGQASQSKDPQKQNQLIRAAAVFESWQVAMPEPKTKKQQAHQEFDSIRKQQRMTKKEVLAYISANREPEPEK